MLWALSRMRRLSGDGMGSATILDADERIKYARIAKDISGK